MARSAEPGTGESEFRLEPASIGVDPAAAAGSGSGDNLSDSDNYERDGSGNIVRNADGSPRKRRGRKPGGGSGSNRAASTGRKAAASQGTISVAGLEAILVATSVAAAGLFKSPEIALESDESGPLAKAGKEVLDCYPLPEISEKAAKWVAFISVAVPMFGAKAMLIKERIDRERAERATPVNGLMG